MENYLHKWLLSVSQQKRIYNTRNVIIEGD